jgi:hypothetical protein
MIQPYDSRPGQVLDQIIQLSTKICLKVGMGEQDIKQ